MQMPDGINHDLKHLVNEVSAANLGKDYFSSTLLLRGATRVNLVRSAWLVPSRYAS